MPPPPEDDRKDADRTVFMPGGSTPPVTPAAAPPSGYGATVPPPGFGSAPPPPPASQPSFPPPPPPEPSPASPVWDAVMPDAAPYAAPPAFASANAPEQGRIAPGVVLNHIYEVRKFIARGGMGEVYEGFNVQTEERVAIKVILSHLAMDPAVQAMFRKEARTLTRLSHPGLVQYRVLAQEPQLGVLYIVTDFIDGGQLSDYVGQIQPTADQLEGLLRRLAAGLAAAHELGAIHRDISPDNVLLPEGRLDQAKVIDFGIAKDLDASSKTIVGDGFAGKLGFVAPEQFGDYDRQIGPWTDVYSLALVVLTLAAGKPVDMGATLVDAIDKRRKGPDLSTVPERIRPVLEGMLKPDPAERYRSMADVLVALDASARGAAAPAPKALDKPAKPAREPKASRPAADAKPPATGKPKSNMPLFAGIGAVVAVLAVVGIVVAMGAKKPAPVPAATPPAADTAAAPAAAAPGADAEKVRKAVEAALPAVACTWLDIDDVNDGSGGVSLRLSGVAGAPVDALAAVQKAAASSGAKVGLVDTANVFPVATSACAPLDAMRVFRAPSSVTGRSLASQQSNWELMKAGGDCGDGAHAKVVIDMKTGPATQAFSLLGMDGKGGLQQIFKDRSGFLDYAKALSNLVSDKGGGDYQAGFCQNEVGLFGNLLVTGQGPFDVGLPDISKDTKAKAVDPAWLKRFADKARAGGWKTSMVWYRVVNDQAG